MGKPALTPGEGDVVAAYWRYGSAGLAQVQGFKARDYIQGNSHRPGGTPGRRCWPALGRGRWWPDRIAGRSRWRCCRCRRRGWRSISGGVRRWGPAGRGGGANRDTVGTPRPAAKCSGPVSPDKGPGLGENGQEQREFGNLREDVRRGCSRRSFHHERGFAFAPGGGEDQRLPGAGREFTQGRPMGQGPFLGAAGWKPRGR